MDDPDMHREPRSMVTASAAEPQLVLQLDRDEWERITRGLRHALGPDERTATGKYGVVVADGRCRWFASDSYRLMVLDAGPADGETSFAVPARLLEAWPLVAASSGSASLTLHEDTARGGSLITLAGPGGSLSLDREPSAVPDPQTLFERPAGDRVRFSADSAALTELLRLAASKPPLVDDSVERQMPFMWLRVATGSLTVEIDWGELGLTKYQVPIAGGAPALVSVHPVSLFQTLAAFEPGDIDIEVPNGVDEVIVLRQGRLTGMLMPLDPLQRVVAHVEAVLRESFGEEVANTGVACEYVLSNSGVPVHARIIPSTPPRLTVSSTVLDDVAATTELFVELNEVNAATGPAKLRWAEGSVVIEAETLAATADGDVIRDLYESVTSFAERLGSALAARYGGRTQSSGRELRWAEHCNALLLAELVPGEWLPLNGTRATTAFPFDGPAFVITAADPHGLRQPAHVNSRRRGWQSADLLDAGAGTARARLQDDNGLVVGEGLLVWDIDRKTVLSVAESYGQEAVFEITPDTVAVIEVGTERVHLQPRRKT